MLAGLSSWLSPSNRIRYGGAGCALVVWGASLVCSVKKGAFTEGPVRLEAIRFENKARLRRAVRTKQSVRMGGWPALQPLGKAVAFPVIVSGHGFRTNFYKYVIYVCVCQARGERFRVAKTPTDTCLEGFRPSGKPMLRVFRTRLCQGDA